MSDTNASEPVEKDDLPENAPKPGELGFVEPFLIPEPEPATLPGKARDYVSTGAMSLPDVKPLARVYSQEELEGMTLAARIRGVWTVTEVVTEQAVLLAEMLYGPSNGAAKRDHVELGVNRFLDAVEDKNDFIPDWIQPIAMRGIRFGLGKLIDRVVGGMNQRGEL